MGDVSRSWQLFFLQYGTRSSQFDRLVLAADYWPPILRRRLLAADYRPLLLAAASSWPPPTYHWPATAGRLLLAGSCCPPVTGRLTLAMNKWLCTNGPQLLAAYFRLPITGRAVRAGWVAVAAMPLVGEGLASSRMLSAAHVETCVPP